MLVASARQCLPEFRCEFPALSAIDRQRIRIRYVRPLKWRDRIIKGAYGSNFPMGKERVVAIEPDGEEEVFGLTTETGNYVVWGLAAFGGITAAGMDCVAGRAG
jgi:hypothetical protein